MSLSPLLFIISFLDHHPDGLGAPKILPSMLFGMLDAALQELRSVVKPEESKWNCSIVPKSGSVRMKIVSQHSLLHFATLDAGTL